MKPSTPGRPKSGKDTATKHETKMVRVTEEDYNELVKIAGIIQLATGKKATMGDAVSACIDTYPKVNVNIRENTSKE